MLHEIVAFLENRFQNNLLPFVESETPDCLLDKHSRVLQALDVVQIERFMPKYFSGYRGRPPRDHVEIARAFVAKHVLNLQTTDQLIHMLKVDKNLRYICGWRLYAKVPDKAKFSRVFSLIAELNIPEIVHTSLMKGILEEEIVPHIVHDSMPIPAQEKLTKKETEPRKRGTDAVCYQQANNNLSLDQMLDLIPTYCSTGRKVKTKGNAFCWKGYKLHASIAEGKFITSMIISSAHTNDSQAAIPLSLMTSEKTTVLYELMDSAYDVAAIKEYISKNERVPIAKPHKRRGTRNEKITREQEAQKAVNFRPAEVVRLASCRSPGERPFALLTKYFSTLSLLVRGYKKVKAHIGLSILAHTAAELRTSPS